MTTLQYAREGAQTMAQSDREQELSRGEQGLA